VECEICGQDVESSDELQEHKKRVHAAGAGNGAVDNLEKPDLLGDTPEESADKETPKPTY
jgi:hypothetical protein